MNLPVLRKMRGISRLAEELLDSRAGLRPMEFVILTFLLVFQVAQSRGVTVQTLHVRSSHFLCYLPFLMKPPSLI